MATTDRNTLIGWFVRGAKPLASQFAAWFNSYWHKDDEIPLSSIAGISEELDKKAAVEAVTTLQEGKADKEYAYPNRAVSSQEELDMVYNGSILIDTTFEVTDGVTTILVASGLASGGSDTRAFQLLHSTNGKLYRREHNDAWGNLVEIITGYDSLVLERNEYGDYLYLKNHGESIINSFNMSGDYPSREIQIENHGSGVLEAYNNDNDYADMSLKNNGETVLNSYSSNGWKGTNIRVDDSYILNSYINPDTNNYGLQLSTVNDSILVADVYGDNRTLSLFNKSDDFISAWVTDTQKGLYINNSGDGTFIETNLITSNDNGVVEYNTTINNGGNTIIEASYVYDSENLGDWNSDFSLMNNGQPIIESSKYETIFYHNYGNSSTPMMKFSSWDGEILEFMANDIKFLSTIKAVSNYDIHTYHALENGGLSGKNTAYANKIMCYNNDGYVQYLTKAEFKTYLGI